MPKSTSRIAEGAILRYHFLQQVDIIRRTVGASGPLLGVTICTFDVHDDEREETICEVRAVLWPWRNGSQFSLFWVLRRKK